MDEHELTHLLVEWSAESLRTATQDLNRFARARGISMLQLMVLTHLYWCGPREVTAFAEIMQVSAAGASQMVERLVQEGVVERQPSTSDRRVREVHLTDAGRTLVQEAMVARRMGLRALVNGLPAEKRTIVAEALALLIEQSTRIVAADESLPGGCPG